MRGALVVEFHSTETAKTEDTNRILVQSSSFKNFYI